MGLVREEGEERRARWRSGDALCVSFPCVSLSLAHVRSWSLPSRQLLKCPRPCLGPHGSCRLNRRYRPPSSPSKEAPL